MIKEILKTLSDTEIMVIADQLSNPSLNEKMIYNQLIAKSNKGDKIDGMYSEMNSDSFRGTLPRLVASELSKRLRLLLLTYSNNIENM
jgi:hypothetical protein